MQQVEEGVAVGIRTGLQQGQHGDQPWVLFLDVYMKISQDAVNGVGSVRLTGHHLKVLFMSIKLRKIGLLFTSAEGISGFIYKPLFPCM